MRNCRTCKHAQWEVLNEKPWPRRTFNKNTKCSALPETDGFASKVRTVKPVWIDCSDWQRGHI